MSDTSEETHIRPDEEHYANILKIGDQISLFSSDTNGYLASLSIAKRNVTVNPQAESFASQFEKCVFLVEAADEDFHSSAGNSVANRVVSYGQHIQLRHVHSGGLLVLRKRVPSECESNCLKVEITQDTSSTKNKDAWWRVLPRFKVRTEGEAVVFDDQIVLSAYKAEEQYLHVSRFYDNDTQGETPVSRSSSPEPGAASPEPRKRTRKFSAAHSWKKLKQSVIPQYEVNASTESHVWTVQPYDSYSGLLHDVDASDDTIVKVGDPLVVFHRESEAFLTADINEENEDEVVYLDIHSTDENCRITELPYSSNALWIVEQQTPWKGGMISWHSSHRFKHLASGKYLAVRESGEGHNIKQRFYLTDSPTFALSIFTFIPFDKSDNLVRTTSFSRIGIGVEGEKGFLSADESSSSLEQEERKKLFCAENAQYQDVFYVQTVPRSHQDDLNKIISAVPPLKSLIDCFRRGRYPSTALFNEVISSLTLLCNFCTQSKEEDPFVRDGIPISEHQSLIVDQNIDQLILQAVGIPFKDCVQFCEVENDRAQIFLKEIHEEQNDKLFVFCQLVYRLLRQIVKDNPELATRILKRCQKAGLNIINFIQSQLGYRIKAADAMLMLVKDNSALLETISEEQIDNFINLMRSKPQVARYLKFLFVLCVCKNRAFAQNQKKVLDRFIHESKDLLVQTKVTGTSEEPQVIVMNPRQKKDEWVEIGYYCENANDEMIGYLEHLTNLYSAICKGRNQEAIEEISQHVSYGEIILILEHPTVPYRIKASYLELVVHLYLNRAPLYSVLDKSTVTSYHSIPEDEDSPIITEQRPETEFDEYHAKLKKYALSIVAETKVLIASQTEKNGFIRKTVSLIKSLVRLGFISVSEIPDIMPTLVQILDGRNDAVDETDYSVYQTRLLGADTGMFSAMGSINALSANGEGKTSQPETPRGQEIQDDSSDDDSFSLKPKLSTVQKSIWNRFAVTERNLAIMQCKIEVIEVISYALDLCLRTNIFVILRKIKAQVLQSNPENSKPFVDQNRLLKTLFRSETLVQLQESLLDTVLYHHSPLINSALGLLFRLFGYSREVSDALSRVTLLHTEENVRAFAKLSQSIIGIRRAARQQLTEENLNFISSMIDDLIQYLEDVESSFEEFQEAQNILLNARAHVSVTNVLHSPGVNVENASPALFNCFRKAYYFLGMFCRGNASNQAKLFPFLQHFISHLGHELKVATTISEMFQDNRRLCSNTPSDVVIQFVRLIVKRGKKPRYLRFLRSITTVSGHPISKNQFNIIKCLMENRRNTLLLFCDYQEKQWRNELLEAMMKDPSDEENSMLINYHLQLVDLLSECCLGLVAGNEITCQSLIPLDVVLDVLVDEQLPSFFKLPYIRFLDEVYIMAERQTNYIGAPLFWKTIELWFSELKAYRKCLEEEEQGSPFKSKSEQYKYVYQGILACVSTIMKQHQQHEYEELLKNEENSQALRNIILEALNLKEVISSRVNTEKVDVKLIEEFLDPIDVLVTDALQANFIRETDHDAIFDSVEPFDSGALQIGDDDDFMPSQTLNADGDDIDMTPLRVKAMTRTIRKVSSQYKMKVDDGFVYLTQVLYSSDHQFVKRFISISDSSEIPTHTKADLLRIFQTFLLPELHENTKIHREIMKKYLPSPRQPGDGNNDNESDENQEEKLRSEIIAHQDWMDQMGATLKLLSLLENRDTELTKECLGFGIRLLEFGNTRVQKTILDYLLRRHDEKLFFICKIHLNHAIEVLNKMKRTHKYQVRLGSRSVYSGSSQRGSSSNFNSQETQEEADVLSTTTDLLRMLQLFCEGHNTKLQDYLRFQHDNNHSFNLVRETAGLLQALVNFLRTLSASGASSGGTSSSLASGGFRRIGGSTVGGSSIGGSRARLETSGPIVNLVHQCLESLIEYVQGPNRGNQHTLISSMVASVVDKLLGISMQHKLDNLMSSGVVLLVSLLEGNADDKLPSIIIKQVSIDRLVGKLLMIWNEYFDHTSRNRNQPKSSPRDSQTLTFGALNNKLRDQGDDNDDDDDVEESLETGFNIFIFLKTMDDFLPEANILKRIKRRLKRDGFRFFADGTGRVEIARDDTTEWVYFRIPSMWRNLSKESKHELQWNVDRENQISKLNDFVYRSEDLIFETDYLNRLHSEYEDNKRMQLLFKNSSRIRDGSIAVAILINLMMLGLFADDGSLTAEDPDNSANFTMFGSASYRVGFDSLPVQYLLRLVLFLLCAVLSVLSLLSFAEFWITKVPIIQFKGLRRDESEEPQVSNNEDHDSDYEDDSEDEEEQARFMDYYVNQGNDNDSLGGLGAVDVQSNSDIGRPAALDDDDNDDAGPLTGLYNKAKNLAEEKILPIVAPYLPLEAWPRIRVLITDSTFLYRSMLVLVSILGTLVSPFFTAVYLLAIIERFRELKNVVRSLTLHGKSLLLTAILGVIIVYLYSVVGFLFFRNKFFSEDVGEDNQCETLFRCLIFTLVYGIRAGGGVGEVIEPGEWGTEPSLLYNTARIVYDSSFFILVIVVLLNIVFGIIIDTFAELRDEKLRTEEDMFQRCFICGIGADQFDRLADGFEEHVKRDHNMWCYVYLIHHLRSKPREEYTGQETFVADKLERNDLSFFPVNHTSVLPNSALIE